MGVSVKLFVKRILVMRVISIKKFLLRILRVSEFKYVH